MECHAALHIPWAQKYHMPSTNKRLAVISLAGLAATHHKRPCVTGCACHCVHMQSPVDKMASSGSPISLIQMQVPCKKHSISLEHCHLCCRLQLCTAMGPFHHSYQHPSPTHPRPTPLVPASSALGTRKQPTEECRVVNKGLPDS